MDKAQAIHQFWSSFGIPAYDETDVPEKDENGNPVKMPYITYSVSTGSIEDFILLTASLWYRSTSWAAISRKKDEIAQAITNMNPPAIKIDGGRVYLSKGSPFSQRMSEPGDDAVRRIYLQLNVEFLTN